MMQRDVGVKPGHAGHGRQGQPGEGRQWMFFGAKAGEHQVEPDYVRPRFTDGLKHRQMIAQLVDLPAPLDIKFGKLGFLMAQLVAQHRETDKWVGLQLAGHVESIFVQYYLAGRKRTNKANFHLGPWFWSRF